MLSLVITIVCFVCYCCHRNIKKRSASVYRQQWLDTDANMEIYSVEQVSGSMIIFKLEIKIPIWLKMKIITIF
jgi:hypothetical protein